MNNLWWHKQPWSYDGGSFYGDRILIVITKDKYTNHSFDSIYLPFITFESKRLRKVILSESK